MSQSQLCDVCRSIDISRPFPGPWASEAGKTTSVWLPLHESAEDVKHAANQGCAMCHILWQKIEQEENRDAITVVDDWECIDDFEDDEDELTTDVESEPRPISMNDPVLLEFIFRIPRRDELATRATDIRVNWTSRGHRKTVHAMNLVTGFDDHLASLCEKRESDKSTDNEYSTELMRGWMRQCLDHPICRDRRAARQDGPTRVVHVGSQTERPRLVICSGNVDYACLSHCWGGSQPFTTKQATLADRLAGFDLDVMPKTFRDAITVTRRLDLKYLWIDSLCIIQDSEDDWAKESARMGRIYQQASVTIFAEFADNDDGGLFFERDGRDNTLVRTPMFDGFGGRSFVQQILMHAGTHSMPQRHHIFETIRNLERMSTKALNQRAWVLQESILSPRALIFDQHEVCWKCPQMIACECLPEGHIRKSWTAQDRDEDVQRELYYSWVDIVSEFCKRKLSYAHNKLPALAGLASEMSLLNKSEYLAGLWKNNLRRHLAWSVPANSVRAPRHVTKRPAYRAPTWSWASIDGNIVTNRYAKEDSHDLECEIVSSHTVPKNQLNKFGEVQSGELVLKGRMGLARVGPRQNTPSYVDRWPLLVNEQLGWLEPDLLPARLVPHMEVACMPLLLDFDVLKCLALVPDGQKWQRIGLISSLQDSKLISWLKTCAVTDVVIV